MYLDKRYNQKHHTYNLRIRQSYRTLEGKTKVRTVENLGTYSEDDKKHLEFFNDLVKNINKALQFSEKEKR